MLFSMNTTAQKTTNSPNQTSSDPLDTVSGVQRFPPSTANDAQHSGLTAAELQTLKDEKLAVIRRALENGDYDSDAILEKALDRMLERLEEADSE
jgi:anti-sigma28 factor (negative regulator of flagellin synthesis)